VYVTAVIVGLMQAFQQPARSAMVSDTVPLEYLTNAIGLNALLFNLARIVGPALAGATIALVGTGGSFTIQSIFLLLATVWTVQIQYTKKSDPIAKEPNKYSLKSNIIEGWRFALATKAVHAGLLCNMIVSLFIVPFTTLLPVFARDILGVGAQGQGFLLTAMGVGALISSCVIAISGHKMVRGQVMLISSLFYGLVVVLFSVSSWFSFSAFVMILVGLCHVHANALVNTIVQTYSPAHFRGRTMALFNMSQLLSTAGSMVIGSLAQTLGPQIAVASMGLMGALSIGMMYYLMPYAKSVK
jgi:predicted MFS family arabinose efflux permease